MSGKIQVLKAIGLFCSGYMGKSLLLSADYFFGVHVLYYLILILITFKYGTSYKHPKLPKNDFSVTIVGAGVSGIAMGIKLKEIGVKFRIIEMEKRLGGTWWLNQYPGCACDIPSHLYSYSFFLNPNWSRAYSPQSEILQYLESAADHFQITQHIEFGKRVIASRWDDDAQMWKLELSSGEIITSNCAISAVGGLRVPSIPSFPSEEKFKGPRFHSAEWDTSYDPTGKRVAVIGTGASAVQIVPAIARKVSHLTVFQRTPAWVPPRDDFKHPGWLKTLFSMFPPLTYTLRTLYFWRNELNYWGFIKTTGFMTKFVRKVITKHTKKMVKDPRLAEKLIPTYEVGCKRITPSNYYLQSFNRDNVSLETSGIKCFTENGIETQDGNLHEVDTIIYATGFDIMKSATEFVAIGRKNGKGSSTKAGQQNGNWTIADEWGDRPNAYKGTNHQNYPNSFFLLGPGSGLGHNSIIFVIECQVNYVIDAITKMVTHNIRSIDIKKAVNDRYQEDVQSRMGDKVFNSTSCVSWYKNKDGINYTLWPSHLTHFWWVTQKVDLSEYNCVYK